MCYVQKGSFTHEVQPAVTSTTVSWCGTRDTSECLLLEG